MCKAIEDMLNETEERMKTEIVERLIKQGKLSYEEISEAAELSVDRVRDLAGLKDI